MVFLWFSSSQTVNVITRPGAILPSQGPSLHEVKDKVEPEHQQLKASQARPKWQETKKDPHLASLLIFGLDGHEFWVVLKFCTILTNGGCFVITFPIQWSSYGYPNFQTHPVVDVFADTPHWSWVEASTSNLLELCVFFGGQHYEWCLKLCTLQ